MARRNYPKPLAAEIFRPLDPDGPALLHDELANRIERLIHSGLLRGGDYLPPLRLLASRLRVSVGTVRRACEEVRRRGLAVTESTRGLRVRAAGHELAGAVERSWKTVMPRPLVPVDPLSEEVPRPQGAAPVRFDVSEPGDDLLPTELMAYAFERAGRDGRALRYAPIGGLPVTLAAIAKYLRTRQVVLDGMAMQVTAGTTQSIAIVTRALTSPGSVVLTEHPTWHVALSVFSGAGIRVIALPMDEEGIQLPALAEAILRYNPAFLYLQPTFQNPTGVSLSLARRSELVALARKLHCGVVEDDFAAELAFEPPVLPPLQHAGADTVIYLKSFAKLLAPALRVGVIVAPAHYAKVLQPAAHGLDPFVSAVAQHALATCLEDPRFASHIKSLALNLRARWQILDRALHRQMPRGATWTVPGGGLCAWLDLPGDVRADQFVLDLTARGVGVAPGRLFAVNESGRSGMRLAFGATTPDDIERGVGILAEVLEFHRSSASRMGERPASVAP